MHIGYGGIHAHWVYLLRSYKRYVSTADIVLEIGASNVKATGELSRYCGELIGLELLPERTPADFDNVRYVTGDWQELSRYIEPETIDIAIADNVIEHVPDDIKALDELFTVLKPGGVALVCTPNRKRLTRTIIETFTGEREFPWWEHMREYTESDLVDLIWSSMFQEYTVIPVGFGLSRGPAYCYSDTVPARFRKYAYWWQVQLFKR